MTLNVDPICVVIGRTRHSMMQAEIQEAARQGARFLEIRLDLLKRPPDFARLLDHKPCPVLATVRRPEDGGRWTGNEEGRRKLLRQAIVAGFDWVDLETDIADQIPRFGTVKRIVSYHNLRETPQDIEEIYARMSHQDGDVVKVAVRAQNPLDNLRVLKLLHNASKPTVAFCMGDMGFASRILGARLGAPFTYAAFNKERTLAPGMPTFSDLKRIYHYHLINADTHVLGVIGDPIAHSLSPLIHNLALRKLGVNAVYLPFRVPAEHLEAFLKAFESIPVLGYSVTIPHKEGAANFAFRRDPAVEQIQAANTLVRRSKGFFAYNTDSRGVLDSLLANMPANLLELKESDAQEEMAKPLPDIHEVSEKVKPAPIIQPTAPSQDIQSNPARPEKKASPITQPTVQQPSFKAPEVEMKSVVSAAGTSLQGRAVLVLGAGGVARAVAHALSREGALLTIANRTSERGLKLAAEIGGRFVEWAGRHSVLCHIVVNCTSVGMHPNVDESPLHPSFFKPGLVIFDTVYTPETTLMVKEARSRGCHVITGVDLFVRQAALQFRLFTGHDAPMDLMRKVIKRALSPITVQDLDETEESSAGEASPSDQAERQIRQPPEE